MNQAFIIPLTLTLTFNHTGPKIPITIIPEFCLCLKIISFREYGTYRILKEIVSLGFWNSDQVVLKLSIRSSALPRSVAV